MMKEAKISIDREKCIGCGLCQSACKEGVIGMEDGKAKVLRPEVCDGLAMCLPMCPVDAISFSGKKKAERNWPLQIKLTPVTSPYFNDVDLLVAADCTAFSYPDFYKDFVHDRTVLIGCPKLDDTDYSDKLAQIIKNNDVRGIAALRMEVPCCSMLVEMVHQAIAKSGKSIPFKYHIVTIDGKLQKV